MYNATQYPLLPLGLQLYTPYLSDYSIVPAHKRSRRVDSRGGSTAYIHTRLINESSAAFIDASGPRYRLWVFNILKLSRPLEEKKRKKVSVRFLVFKIAVFFKNQTNSIIWLVYWGKCLLILIDCSQLSKCYSLNVRRYMRRAWRPRAEQPNNTLQVFCRVTGFTSDFLSFIVVETYSEPFKCISSTAPVAMTWHH